MKYFFRVITLVFFASVSYGQDTIVRKDGSSILSKVIEIDKTDIKYKKFENLEGPSYLISKSEINYIRYQNGTVDSFNVVTKKQPVVYVKKPLSEMYLKGQEDAKQYYTRYKPAADWTLGLTIPLNAFGIFPAVIFSATPPEKENLGYPDENLIKDAEYLSGYINGAKNKKAGKVMKKFAIGGVISFAMYGSLLLILK